MKNVINLLFGQLFQSLYAFKFLIRALQLWSLNLLIPLCFCITLPLLVKNLGDIPLAIYELFRGWLVGGFRFHLVLYTLCLIYVIFEEYDTM